MTDVSKLANLFTAQSRLLAYKKSSKKRTEEETELADINGDGKVNSKDYTAINKAIKEAKKQNVFDFNGDEKVDINDWLLYGDEIDLDGDGEVSEAEKKFLTEQKKTMQSEVAKSVKSDKYTGEFNGKMYKEGKVLTGFADDGKYYSSGKLKTGSVSVRENGKSVVYYFVNGEKAQGKVGNYLYKDGQKYTGTNEEDGLYYKSGRIYSGTTKSGNTTANYKKGVLQYSTTDNNGKDYPKAVSNTIQFSKTNKITLEVGASAVINEDGTVSVTQKDGTIIQYDKNGNQIQANPIIEADKVTFANGMIIQIAEGGGASINDEGNVEIKYVSDDSTEIFTYDTEGLITKHQMVGANINSVENYKNGNIISEENSYYDENGNVTASNKSKYEYDEQHNIVSSEYTNYDENGNVTDTNKSKYEYDESGNKISEENTYYDENGNVTASNKTEYDEQHNIVSAEYTNYDENGEIASSEISKYEYDENGNLISQETSFYDENGKITSLNKCEYDENGNIKLEENTYYDENGNVIASYKEEYDEQHNIVSSEYTNYDENGKVTYYSKVEYDESGHKISEENTYYDENGKVTDSCKSKYEYDEQHNIVSIEYTRYDANGKVTDSYKTEYDENGNRISVEHTCYDENGKVTDTNKSKYEYDENGNKISEENTRYDENGNVLASEVINNSYDENNNLISRNHTIADTTIPSNNRKFEELCSYDSTGNCVSITKKFDNDNDGTFEEVKLYNDTSYLNNDIIELLKNVETSDLTDRVLDDIQIVKNAETAGLLAGAKGTKAYEDAYKVSIKSQMIRTESNMTNTAGEVVEKADGLYVNNGTELVKLNISADTYLKLFPPIERYDINQGSIGDCYFISGSLIDMMKNPTTFAQMLQMFSENTNGDITIQFDGTLQDTPVTFTKGELETLDGLRSDGEVLCDEYGIPVDYKQVTGSKGLQLLEQAYAIARFSKECTTDIEDVDIDEAIQLIEGGWQTNVYKEILDGDSNYYSYNNDQESIDYWKEQGLMSDDDIIEDFTSYISSLADKVNNNETLLSLGFYGWTYVSDYDIYGGHAYSVEKIDTENQTVYITNPWYGGASIAVPISVLEQLSIGICTHAL